MHEYQPSSRRPPTTKRRLPALMLALALLVSCVGLGLGLPNGPSHTAHAAIATNVHEQAPLTGGLQVSGNHLVNTANPGVPLQLRGVNRSGTEYACIQGWGIFDGPSDAGSVQAIAAWGANVVRIPLNEDCWLGINGVPSQYAGANYIGAIQQFVSLLHQNGMYAELSLIWGAPGSFSAGYQPAAPDEDHSPAMWQSLAQTFAGDPNVILAPWGETTVSWACFEQGGTYGGSTGCDATYGGNNTPYTVAGMDQAVSVMRSAGYHGVIAIPCLDYANNCNSGAPEFYGWGGSTGDWVTLSPSDPDHNLVAEAHVYGKNTCDTAACLTDTIGPQLGSVPFIFGETGETYDGSDCNNSSSYISTFMNWADAHGVGYEAWTWDTWGSCNLALITSYSGTPYGVYGTYVQQHLLALAGGGGTPTPTATVTVTTSPSPTATNSPTPTNTPTNTPSPSPTSTPTNTPTPSPTPAPCAQGVASWAHSTAQPNPVTHGAQTLLATAVRMKCGGQAIIVDFQEFPASGGGKIGEQWVTVTSSTAMTAYAVAWTPASAGTYYVSTAVFSGDWSVLYNWHDHAIGTLTAK